MASNPPPNDNDKNEKEEQADDVEKAWIPLTVLEDDVTSSASLLAALDLAQAKVPLQRRGNYRPVGAFAVRPPGRTSGGLASETSIDSQLTEDNNASTTVTTTSRRSGLFRVPVADLVDHATAASAALALRHDIEIAEVYPGHPIISGGAADTTIATVDTDAPESKSFLAAAAAAAARTNQGSSFLVRRLCCRDSSSNGPYCSRLFYTLLCLLLVVFMIVAIVWTVNAIQDEQDTSQPAKKKWLVPTLKNTTTVSPENATILGNGTE
jgi:hypothetical protein